MQRYFLLGHRKKPHTVYMQQMHNGATNHVSVLLYNTVNKKQINWSNNPQIGNRDKTWGVIYMESVLSLFLFLWYNNKQLLEKQFTLLCNKNEIQCIALYQIHVDEWSHFHEHHVIFLHVKARQMSTSIYLYDLIN